MAKPYDKAPIDEALCEFRFSPDTAWDGTMAGHMHLGLASTYDGGVEELQEIQVQQSVSQNRVSIAGRPNRTRLRSSDGRRALVIGPRSLSVHVLRPYPNWAEFRPDIEHALGVYREVAKPKTIERVGIRYINSIPVPAMEAVSEFIKLGRVTPPEITVPLRNAFHRVEHQYPDKVALILAFATLGTPEKPTVILDIDVVHQAEPIEVDDVMAKVEDLHEREGAAFEALITDMARSTFK